MPRNVLMSGPKLRPWSLCLATAVGLAAAAQIRGLVASPEAGSPTEYYSTAPPPVDYAGAAPAGLASVDAVPRPKSPGGTARLASDARDVAAPALSVPGPSAAPAPKAVAKAKAAPDPIAEAKAAIAACQARYATLRDYSCTFFKRERMSNGRMTGQHVMLMKARTTPFSIYFKFLKPNAGREVIYVQGRNGNRAQAHDVGLGKLLAGTLDLDPRSSMAMEENRHPITEAGLGHLIEEVSSRWAVEMQPGETVVTIHRSTKVGDRICTMIESKHPAYHASYLFHKVKVYIDNEHNLPIRFEAYDWPKRPGAPAELVEEYSYVNLKPNAGLSDRDFDAANPAYSFGRF
jgi:hypothetical protein